jgi:two-component system cell cycle sensor histidine kinase/response regulator CckA
VEALDDWVWMTDVEGRHTYSNPAVETILGYSPQEVLGTSTELMAEQDRARFAEMWTRLVGEGAGWSKLLLRWRHRDGSDRYLESTGLPLTGRSGEVAGFIGIDRDVTARVLAERDRDRLLAAEQEAREELERALAAQRQSEERFRTIVEATQEWVWATDVDGVHTYSNPAVEAILGYSPEEIVGMAQELMHPQDRADVQAVRRERIARAEGWKGRIMRWRHRDGSWRYLESNAAPIVGPDGEVQGLIGSDRDVTERILAEEERMRLLAAERDARASAEDALRALDESAARYRQLFENARDSILVIGPDGRLVAANDAALRLTGYGRDELVGMDVMALVAPTSVEKAREQFQLKLSGAVAHTSYEVHLLRKDGRTVPVEIHSWVIEEAGKPVAVHGIVRDVTERHELEEQLRHAQKMDALGRLAGGISHDFNNLLTAMSGYCEFLLAGLDERDPLRHDAEEIRKAAERAAGLTRQLLAFSRRQVLEPHIVDLNAVITETERLLRRLIGEQIELGVHLSRELGHVRTDPGQIEQVIVNLAVNARDAMPHGGQLTIETFNVDVGAGEVSRARVPAGSYVALAVADTGVGMDGDTQSHLYEPFFTTKEDGTGLGLATVYGIVRQSGGTVVVDSELDQGSRFTVYLPRIEEPLEDSAQAPGEAGELGGAETVLVVEDEETVRRLVAKFLERRGYAVLTASDSLEALAIGRDHRGPIDLLVTDVVMPSMNGPELAEQFLTLRPGAGVLYVSGYSDEAIGDPTVRVAGSVFLQKPFSESSLAQKVRDALQGRG